MTWNDSYSPPYSLAGPFVSGGVPGVDAPFLNKIEGWVDNTDAPPASVLNGSTSGTATLYQMPWSGIKLAAVYLSNFRNGGGGAQNIAIPIPFISVALIASGDVNTFQLLRSGSGITLQVITTLAGAGGTFTNESSMGSASFAQCGGFDTLSFLGGAASAHYGYIFMLGV